MKIDTYGIYNARTKSLYPITKDSLESLKLYMCGIGIFEDENDFFQIVKVRDLDSYEETRQSINELISQIEESFNKETKGK